MRSLVLSRGACFLSPWLTHSLRKTPYPRRGLRGGPWLTESLDNHVRRHFPNDPEEVVAEVVRARKGIWGGPTGGEWRIWLPHLSQTDMLSKQKVDKRQRNTDEQATKRRKLEEGEEGVLPIYATKFSDDVLQAEERRPKKKVAVLIGYAGTGYHGMQLSVCLRKNFQRPH
jgi:hypothetical protein